MTTTSTGKGFGEATAAVSAKLDSIKWDFTDSAVSSGLHAIHPYPAKFIPEIPRALIGLFHRGDSTAILDPFCGSGTSLLESVYAGLEAVGVDVNPLAVLIAKVKTTALRVQLSRFGHKVCTAAQNAAARDSVEIPTIPNLDHWFEKPVQRALAALVSQINSVEDCDVANALRVALSSMIVRVSNQESDTRYAAVKKDVAEEDVWCLFERAVLTVERGVAELAPHFFRPQPKVSVLLKDLMQLEPAEIGRKVGLVITSPPYPNAYEYWLYHKYRMFWLGMDPITVRQQEIGARPHYFKKRRLTEHDFERQMGRCFWLLSQVMVNGGYACFVVGRSIIHGREIDNHELLKRAASPFGFREVGWSERKIAPTRKAFNPAHGSITRERIVVFVLEGRQ